jgi:hypothetical protein
MRQQRVAVHGLLAPPVVQWQRVTFPRNRLGPVLGRKSEGQPRRSWLSIYYSGNPRFRQDAVSTFSSWLAAHVWLAATGHQFHRFPQDTFQPPPGRSSGRFCLTHEGSRTYTLAEEV